MLTGVPMFNSVPMFNDVPILVINLEHRKDRLHHVSIELNKVGKSFTRIDAVSDDFGAIGCTKSHIKALEYALEQGLECVCIMEDDFTFSNVQIFNQSMKLFSENQPPNWDVLLLGGNNQGAYSQKTPFCINITRCACAVGYIVKSTFYENLLQNFREGLANLILSKNKQLHAIDMYWMRLQTSMNWYLLVPLSVTQYANYSDIEQCQTDYTGVLTNLDKSRVRHSKKSSPFLM